MILFEIENEIKLQIFILYSDIQIIFYLKFLNITSKFIIQ